MRLILTRNMKITGQLAAGTLAELQAGPARKLAKRICNRHVWRRSRWSRECTRCGLTEDRVPGAGH
jgi:hypothetical protein